MKKVYCFIMTVAALSLVFPMAAATMTFEEHKLSLDEHSLPIINLVVNTSAVNPTDYTDATIEVVDPQCRTAGQSDLTLACKVRYRGTSALNYKKKSFAVKLYDEAGEDLDMNMFGIREENSWILDAMAADRSRMRNRVLFDIWNSFSRLPYDTDFGGRNGTVGLYVELYLNGNYWGLYCFSDKIDRKLLDLKKAKVDDQTGDVTVRGVLYKCTNWGKASYLSWYVDEPFDNLTWNNWELKVPEEYPSQQAWQPLANLVDFLGGHTSTDEQYLADWDQWLYRTNIEDYALFLLAFRLNDNTMKNTYLSVPNITKGHRFVLTPWDLDVALGGSFNTLDDHMVNLTLLTNTEPYCRLFELNDDFRNALSSRWRHMRESAMAVDSVADRMRAYALQMTESGAWAREYARWAPANPSAKGYVELADTPDAMVDYMIDWYTRNRQQVNTLLGEPERAEGDLNNDGIVDVSDINIIIDIVLKGRQTVWHGEWGDINHDEVIDVVDLSILIDKVLG